LTALQQLLGLGLSVLVHVVCTASLATTGSATQRALHLDDVTVWLGHGSVGSLHGTIVEDLAAAVELEGLGSTLDAEMLRVRSELV